MGQPFCPLFPANPSSVWIEVLSQSLLSFSEALPSPAVLGQPVSCCWALPAGSGGQQRLPGVRVTRPVLEKSPGTEVTMMTSLLWWPVTAVS